MIPADRHLDLRTLLWMVNRLDSPEAAADFCGTATRSSVSVALDAASSPRMLAFNRSYVVASLQTLGCSEGDIEQLGLPGRPPGWAHFDGSVASQVRALIRLSADAPTEAAARFGYLTGHLWQRGKAQRWREFGDTIKEVGEAISPPRSVVHLSGPWSTVDSTGSGKRERDLPSISTGASIVASMMASRLGLPVRIAKSVSGGTTYGRGSADELGAEGVPILTTPEDPASFDTASQSRLTFWRCEALLPEFARLYHGLAVAPTVISLAAPAALASPIARSRIIYGLSDGDPRVCGRALALRFPRSTEVLVLQGLDGAGRPALDEPSPYGSTKAYGIVAQRAVRGPHKLGDFIPVDVADAERLRRVPLREVLGGEAHRAILAAVAMQASLMLLGQAGFDASQDGLRRLGSECLRALERGDALLYLRRLAQALRGGHGHVFA